MPTSVSGRVVVPVGLDGCRPGVGRATASRPYLGDLHAMAIVTPGPSLADIRQTSSLAIFKPYIISHGITARRLSKSRRQR